jgi:nucleoside phosphorylase/tetratricopeptide (TPR) repeat protein
MHADILLMTVTPVETNAVLKVFEKAGGRPSNPVSIGDRIYHDLAVIKGVSVFMVQSAMGASGPGAAQETVQKGIDALSPSAVIMVGIAFGIDAEKHRIGDILVSHRLTFYDCQRASTDKEGKLKFIARGARPDASTWLFNRFQSAYPYWKSKAKVRFGLILCGEKLVDNLDFRQQLREFEPEALGGEMEGAGLYAGCQGRRVDWILVKAISDWADGHKDEDRAPHQRLAARNAAKFVLHVLELAPLKQDAAAAPPHAPEPLLDVPVPRASQSSLPHQLYFCGREKELKIIADALSPESRGWGVLIDGPGGVGKTALAIRAGYLAPQTNFPRKIFLSAKVRELREGGEHPLPDFMLPNFMTLLSELAAELGETNFDRTPDKERANTVRHVLAGKKVLMVIDNVEAFEEDERVRLYQFLSRLPPACKAIVTSRRRSDIDARAIRLDRLSLPEALDLLRELAESNPRLARIGDQDRTDLYEATQGNPLLIKWVAGQLGRPGGHCRTIAAACEFMKSASPGNDPLEFIFGDLLGTFTASETVVLAALTHFAEPAKVEWIADLAALPPSAAQTALEDLADRALLVGDETARTFLLPPLVSTFLRRKRPEIIAQTGNRLANRVFALVLENGGDRHERFPKLEAEWPKVAAALPLLVEGNYARLQRVGEALIHFLHFSGRWDDWLRLNQELEERALAEYDFERAGWRALQRGWIYHLRGQSDEVLACADRCEAHWKEGDAGAEEKVAALQLRGIGYRLKKDYPAAIAAFKKALALDRTLMLEEEVANDLNHLAEAERLSGDYAAADRHYREALRYSREIDYEEGVANFTGNVAALALDRKDWYAAEALASDSLRRSESLRSGEAIAKASCHLAKAVAMQGRLKDALPHARRAVDLFTKLRMPENLLEAQAVLTQCEDGV